MEMLIKFVRDKRLLAFVPTIDGIFTNKYDRVEGTDENEFFNTDEGENTTGLQRLRNLFRKHEDQPIHPAVIGVMQNSIAAFIIGGIYGAATNSRTAFINFIERNEATQFRNHMDAKRKLSDAMFTSYIKGFGKWGFKVCIFVTTFTATQLVLSVYQNRYAFWHYSAGGTAAGAIYKFQLGPKGIFAGAVFGGFFGTLYGSFKVLILKLTNQTEGDLLKFRQDLKIMKDEYTFKADKKYESKEQEEELKEAMLNPKGIKP